MERKPTYAGKADIKDEIDILFWALEKSPKERIEESWRLNCLNHGINIQTRLNKKVFSARKRD